MECHTLTTEQFEDFSAIIAGTLGIKMPPAKRVMLQSRIQRRLRELNLDSFAEYHARFFNDPEHQAAEIEHLLNLATTNKTDFFREPDHFEVLTGEVLAHWRRRPPSPVFRVWCAGCSSGEEAYTIAMCLLEQQARGAFEFSILATDVCTRVLHAAMQGIYAEAHAAPIPPALRQKYLLRSRDAANRQVRIAPEVRAHVRFGHLNFLSPDYGIPDTMDAIFFRNVMIYFDRPTQQQVVGRMCRHLRPDGYLFTAHAETLQGLGLPLRNAGTAVYRLDAKPAAV
jgi:chemotaxis protein methyltransferase CheR